MAMNKKEMQMVKDLKISLSLRFTDKVIKDIPVPVPILCSGSQLIKGFTYNEHSVQVNESCSTSVGHSVHSNKKTSSQNGISMFSTKILALKALRNSLEVKAANVLYKIDKLIEEELSDAAEINIGNLA